MHHDVELPAADGTTLRGRFYRPEAPTSPAVLMTHGFSATIEMALDGYATAMCDAGLAVLMYDHRHLGASDGEPRQVVNPWRQTRDQMSALGWLAAQPEVDAERIGVWGSSFSGGQALVLGAVDPRVKAVVANVPFVGGFGGFGADALTDAGFEAFRAALLDDTAASHANATDEGTGPLAVVNEGESSGPAFLPQAEAAEWFLDVGRKPAAGWQNQVWLQRAFGTEPAFDPAVCLKHLHAPALFVVATKDDLANTEAELQAYEAAVGAKDLLMIEGHHFTPYSGDALMTAANAARDWFLRSMR